MVITNIKRSLLLFASLAITLIGSYFLTTTASAQTQPIITEYTIPTAEAKPFNIIGDADGNMWFSEFRANKVGKVTQDGVFTEYDVAIPGSEPNDLAIGHDGNVWFSQSAGFNVARIANITPTGTITEYTVPTTPSAPGGIIAGPDNSMWFAEYYGNKVTKMAPDGTFTQYPVPTAGSRPYDITYGPDGNIWFTEHFGNKVAKISPDGIITEYLIPTPNSRPAEIATGPDGNLWFSLAAGGKLARVTPDGIITEFPLPDGDSPYGITAGLDGNVWFTDNGNHVGYITMSGDITRFPIPTPDSNPLGMATDPYGNIWFVERLSNKVAKVSFPVQNNAPELNPIGNKTITEGQTLEFTVSATDSDASDTLTYSAANLPAGSSFDPATGIFSWTPGFTDAGNYTDIEFTVTDDGEPMLLDVELITITVGDINRAPVFATIGSQSVLEEDLLTFVVSATDPDGDAVSLSVTNLPTGASFDDASGSFSWTPDLTQADVYTVSFTATDDNSSPESSALDVVITVGDNPTPTEQAEDLVEDVVDLDLPTNTENSYLANLQKVAVFIENGKIQAALNQLNAFVNKVEQDYIQGEITEAERDALLAAADNLVSDLQL